MMRVGCGLVLVTLAGTSPALAQRADLQQVLRQPAVQAAVSAARLRETETLDRQIRYCEVEAPPFAESARAEILRREFTNAGLSNVRIDAAGNVLGERRGASARPRLVLAAHLDTVFPAGTPVKVSREAGTLRGPGIGDNCRGLAVLVSVAHLLADSDVRTPGTITFVANVGEEGLGDLRGVRALFSDTLRGEIDQFVAIDGGGLHVTNVAVGSYRYRVTFSGPGGHSFGAFGLPNPAHALGRAVAAIAEFTVPSEPRTTFNVGRIGGGTSVNAIPAEVWMEVDLRSADPAALRSLDERFHRAIDRAVDEEQARWGRAGDLTARAERVGQRPAGTTAADSPIVRAAREAAQVLGLAVPLGEGSTDANLPISLGIPAITIGGGGLGYGAHALTESFDTADSWHGTAHALLVAVALARQ